MNTPDSISIVRRFFDALQRLKADRRIRGKKTFTDRYGINRWNLNTCEKQPERDMFQPAWLAYLASDYGVSPEWLLLGEGDFYRHSAHDKHTAPSVHDHSAPSVHDHSAPSLERAAPSQELPENRP